MAKYMYIIIKNYIDVITGQHQPLSIIIFCNLLKLLNSIS